MDPINYTSAFANIPSPTQAFTQGLQSGALVDQLGIQQQQQQLQLSQARQQSQAITSLMSNPNAGANDYAKAIVLVPGLREQLGDAWKTKSAEQQQSLLNDTGQVYAALANGQPKYAADILNKKADALEASGASPQEIQSNRTLAQLALDHPDFARAKAGMMLTTLPGGDKVIDGFAKLARTPADVRKAEADATVSEVAAGNASTKTELDNQQAQQAIQTAEAQRRIADLNVQISQANSETDRGKLVLERDKWQAELNKTQQTQGQGAQDQIDTLTNALDTVKSLTKHPGLSSGTGSGGDFQAWFNGSDAADFRAQVDTLKSQQFLAQTKQLSGMGALSDAEGARLERAVASLDTRQSEGQFRAALGVVQSTLEKAQKKLIARGQAPTSGTTTPVIMTHPTFGQVRDADVNRLMLKYPGQTRDQVIQFLRETGGK